MVLESTATSGVGYVEFVFTTVTAIPSDGKILLGFPVDFTPDVSGTATSPSAAGYTVIDGTLSVASSYGTSATNDVMTITRSGGSATTGGQSHKIRITGVTNPTTSGTYNTWLLYTTDNTGSVSSSGVISGTVLDSITSGLSTSIYGTLTSTLASSERLERGALTNFQADFKTASVIPSDGKVILTFPATYTVSAVTSCVNTAVASSGYVSFDGTFASSVSGTVVTCTRSGGTATTAGAAHAITIATITNPQSSGTQSVTYQTATSSGTILDAGTATVTISTATALNSAAVTLEHYEREAVGWLNFAFTTTTDGAIPADGVIKIYQPSGFSVPSSVTGTLPSTSACVTSGTTAIDGTLTTTVSGTTFIVTRSGGTATNAGDTHALQCSDVTVSTTSGVTASFQMQTLTAGSATVLGEVSVGVTTTVLTYGALPSSLSLSSDLRSATAALTITFTPTTAVPATGVFKVDYPTAFTVSSAPTATSSMDGTFSTSLSGTVVTITRSGGSTAAAGSAYTLTLASTTNPAASGTTATFKLYSQSDSTTIVDQRIDDLTTSISTVSSLAALSVALARTPYAAIGTETFTFTTVTAIPSDGKILITLPTGWSLPSGYTQTATTTGATAVDGTLTVSTSGQVVTITRSGGTATTAGNSHSIAVTNIQNVATASTTSATFDLTTQDASSTILDDWIGTTATATTSAVGALNGASVATASATISVSTTITLTFTTTNPIPDSGKIGVVFPSDYTVATDSARTATSSASGSCVAIDGTLTPETPVLSSGIYTLTITRSGGTATTAGACHTLAITLITNPSTTGTTSSFTITTQDSSSTTLDSVSTGVTVTLEECSNSCSSVGTCVSGVCHCNEWYSGSYCQNSISNSFMSYLRQTTYELAWSTVPTTQPARTDFTETSLGSQYCSCDLTADACDLQCSCDADCATYQLDLAANYLTTTNTTSEPRLCSEFSLWNMSQASIRFNGRTLIYDYPQPWEQELCVEAANNPSRGKYYTDPGALTATQLAETAAASAFEFTVMATATPTHTGTKYLWGDLISTKETSSDISGYLRLPTAFTDGECVKLSRARFLIDVTNNTCSYQTYTLSTACTGELDVTAYVDAINAMTTHSSATPTYVTVTVTNTGGSASFSGSTCTNAVTGLAYTVTHDNDGSITAISVVVTTGSVVAETDTDRAKFDQTFSIQYVSSSASSPIITRSGNLGYNPGQVVMSGTLSTSGTQTAISQTTSGLTVDTTIAGSSTTVPLCGSSSTTNRVSSIGFLESSSLCCDVELTLAELQTACGTNSTSQHVSSGTYLGIWGGSDYTNTADWLLLPDPVAPDSAQYHADGTLLPYWDADTLTCYGIYHGSERLQMVYGYEGPQANPQGKVVAARQVWEPQTYAWPDFSTQTGSNRFPVCYTVSWEQQSNIQDGAAALPSNSLYFLFVDKHWGQPVASKNAVIIFVGGILIWAFTTYLLKSETLPTGVRY